MTAHTLGLIILRVAKMLVSLLEKEVQTTRDEFPRAERGGVFAIDSPSIK